MSVKPAIIIGVSLLLAGCQTNGIGTSAGSFAYMMTKSPQRMSNDELNAAYNQNQCDCVMANGGGQNASVTCAMRRIDRFGAERQSAYMFASTEFVELPVSQCVIITDEIRSRQSPNNSQNVSKMKNQYVERSNQSNSLHRYGTTTEVVSSDDKPTPHISAELKAIESIYAQVKEIEAATVEVDKLVANVRESVSAKGALNRDYIWVDGRQLDGNEYIEYVQVAVKQYVREASGLLQKLSGRIQKGDNSMSAKIILDFVPLIQSDKGKIMYMVNGIKSTYNAIVTTPEVVRPQTEIHNIVPDMKKTLDRIERFM